MTNHHGLRILFVHGLESGPHGRKSAALREAGFEVLAMQMPCSRKHLLRDPVLLAAGGLALVLLGLALATRGAAWLFALLGLLVGARFLLPSLLLRRAFEKSIRVQKLALETHAIDLVVGSSFGGAVVLALLERGFWNGPTLLLCPAHRLVVQRARVATLSRLSEIQGLRSEQILLVHGTQDETVPIEDSRNLVLGSKAKLLEVEDDHRLSTFSTAQNFNRVIHAMLTKSPS